MTELDRIPAEWMQPDTITTQFDLQKWAQDFRDVYQIAEALCKTSFVPREMLGKQNEVAACIMRGRELGLSPFDALGSTYIVHGRVGFYAEFLRRRIIEAGHTFRIVESGEQRCIVEGIRREGGDPHRASFTADQARRAGIDLGKYPADKLIARATSRLCKQAFPDVLSGSLIVEDIIDGVIPAPPEVAADPAPTLAAAPVQRTRKTKPAKATATQPKAAAPAAESDDDLTELLGDDGELAETAAIADETAAEAQHAGEPGGWVVEPTPAEPEPEPPSTQAQNRKMHVLFREHGLSERQDRLIVTSEILGYTLNSSIGLTRSEANHVIDILEAWVGDPTTDERIREILNIAALTETEKDLRNETE